MVKDFKKETNKTKENKEMRNKEKLLDKGEETRKLG
jgi:hypothetical protein